MDPSSLSFTYLPFQNDEEIRLLELLPADDFLAPIECEISNVKLAHDTMFSKEKQPEYEALSYVWGDPHDTVQIFLGDGSSKTQPFFVTRNLASALQHLRNNTESRTLWVDAICIDQSNLRERERQVSIMCRIYRRAKKDLLWLGESNEASVDAFDLLEQYQTAMEASLQKHTFYIQQISAPIRPKTIEESRGWGWIGTISAKNWLSFRETFNKRPVWRRVW
jgi:heterokaryon incompatibility protein (HET)